MRAPALFTAGPVPEARGASPLSPPASTTTFFSTAPTWNLRYQHWCIRRRKQRLRHLELIFIQSSVSPPPPSDRKGRWRRERNHSLPLHEGPNVPAAVGQDGICRPPSIQKPPHFSVRKDIQFAGDEPGKESVLWKNVDSVAAEKCPVFMIRQVRCGLLLQCIDPWRSVGSRGNRAPAGPVPESS